MEIIRGYSLPKSHKFGKTKNGSWIFVRLTEKKIICAPFFIILWRIYGTAVRII